MTDYRAELADTIAALVDPYEHVELLRLRSAAPDDRATATVQIHRSSHPSLLDQLRSAAEPSSSAKSGSRGGGYESSPAADLDAIDRLEAIDHESRWLMRHLGHRPAVYIDANLRAIAGRQIWLAGREACVFISADELPRIAKRARYWLTWARLATDWDEPAPVLRGRCPHCGQLGTIRASVNPMAAWCTACHETWSTYAAVYELAANIRERNGEPA